MTPSLNVCSCYCATYTNKKIIIHIIQFTSNGEKINIKKSMVLRRLINGPI